MVEKMGGKGGGHTSRSDGRITIEPEEEEEAFELSAGQAAQRQVREMERTELQEISDLRGERDAALRQAAELQRLLHRQLADRAFTHHPPLLRGR